MPERTSVLAILVIIVVMSAACNGCSESVPTSEDAQSFAEQLQQDFNDPAVEALSTDDLRKVMPDRVAGMSQTDFKSNRTGAFGFKLSSTTSEYQEGNRKITLTVTDAGTMKAAVRAANKWMDNDFEETTSTGYSRTGEFFGYRGIEEFNSGPYGTSTELSIFVGDRFVVNGKGTNVDMDDLKGAVKDIKLGRLERRGD